jgi:hypothetical protein
MNGKALPAQSSMTFVVAWHANPGLPTAPSTRTRNPIADFKRGIKHDTSDPKATNLRLDSLGGGTSTRIIKSHHDSNESSIDFDDGETKENHRMPVGGKVLFMDLQEDGQQKADRILSSDGTNHRTQGKFWAKQGQLVAK